MEALDWLVQHADYVRIGLLSALLLFPRGQFVRLGVALFAGLELALALEGGSDRVRIIWSAALLGVALLILTAGILARRAARLTPEEQAMAERLLKGVGRSSVRHFIDQGYWLSGRPGEVLLREGEPVTQFCYLSEGEARVMMAGRPIGFSRGGDVIGGLGFFSGETAAATVILTTPARFWCAPAERFHPYLAAQPDLRRKLRRNMGGGVPEEPEEDEPVTGDAPTPLPAE